MTSLVLDKQSLSFETSLFSETSGEITFRANAQVGETVYRLIPYLRLQIHDWEPDNGEVWWNDEYHDMLPYPKPVESFRTFMIVRTIPQLLESSESVRRSPLLQAALKSYAEKLRTFSEDAAVVRQAKTATNRLKHQREDEVDAAYAVLSALGKVPVNARGFDVQ